MYNKTTENMPQIINTIRNYFKTRKSLKRACQEENLLSNLSQSFGHKFKMDKLGRIYTVINPLVQNINTGGNTIIYDGNNEPMIQEYLIKNMMILKSFIGENNFFDILTYDIDKLDDDQNYLVVLKPIFLDDTIKYFKIFSYIIVLLTATAVIWANFI